MVSFDYESKCRAGYLANLLRVDSRLFIVGWVYCCVVSGLDRCTAKIAST